MRKTIQSVLILLFSVSHLFSQRTITGHISNEDGESVIGATLIEKGTSNGTVSDFDGNYEIAVQENAILVVSYTGYQTNEFEVGASSILDITLEEGLQLSEVVVTALGISREKKSLGYAITQVDGADIAQAKETNLVNALQGRIAGVQIGGSPSTMGGSSRITIRGANSFLGNNQPLFVVDGVPIDNSNRSGSSQARGFGGSSAYDYGNAAQDIDPESIESLSVLKGAAATALYGQRGANGVIQIITKGGRGQKGLGIEINSQFNFDEVRNLIPHQREYGGGAINGGTDHGFFEVIQDGDTYLYPAYSKDGAWGPKYDPNVNVRHWDSWDADNPATYKETRPWIAPPNDYSAFFETGFTRTNSIALTGGNDLGGFRIGYSNLGSQGTIPNGQLDRNTFTLKSDYDINERVNISVTGNYIVTNAENRNITGYNNGNPLQAFTQWWQTQLDVDRLKNTTRTDGTQHTWNAAGVNVDADNNFLFYDPSPFFFDNPYWVRENFLQEDTRNRFIGKAAVSVDLGKGLSLIGSLGSDWYQTSARAGIPVQSVETSLYREDEIRFNETNLETRLNYNKEFGEFSLTAFVGGNRMRQLNRSTFAETSGGLSLDGFYNVSNSSSPASIRTYETERGINSVLGGASFGYKSWLYFDVTARNDWSSTLPRGENSYFYPSVTLSGVLSELAPFQNSKISFLKVRASYAQAGNDADTYRLTDVFSAIVPNIGNAPRYAVPNSQNNLSLKPERTTELEFGLDARFLNNRFGVDVAYFKRNTKDQIFSVPTSAATGYTSRILNSGEMENSGIELQLNATPIMRNDFSWNIGVNIAKLNNKVVSLADGVESIDMGGTWAADLRVQEGQKYMALYGQDYVYDDNGNKTVDENGAYMFTTDRVYLGSALADWVGGISTSISFKSLTISGLFHFQYGGIMHSTSLQWSKYSGMHPETVAYKGQTNIRENGMILDGVQQDGSPNSVSIDPQFYYQTYWRRAAPNVYKSDFFKLRELRLSYTIPNKVFGKSPFKDVTVAVTGRNLVILGADIPYIDPQVITGAGNTQGLENAQVPPTRTFGFNISFKL
ncbi:MAG: SusC/RagA family TonB-linked outer membrane protein [Saprospiraceae bacterium]